MKVLELKEFSLDGLTLTERPQPKPGAGEVLVRMHAASLNYRDVLIAKGLYPEKFQLPIVPVSEARARSPRSVPELSVSPGATRSRPCRGSSGFRAKPAMRCTPTS